MKNKTLIPVLITITLASLIFGGYEYFRGNEIQAKYEEAIVDVEDATTRLEKANEQLEAALAESEKHRKMAEEALAELNKSKSK